MEYWTPQLARLEFKANLALDFLEKGFAVVAGKFTDLEDSVGRSRLLMQEPQELVDRAFAIADAFVTTAESRGLIRNMTPEQLVDEELTKYDLESEHRAARRNSTLNNNLKEAK